jgi:DNA-binding GntR family transcriptional regulator
MPVGTVELERRGLREQIADRLRDDILSGRIAEGERISEPQLVKRFGVSRAPIREALVKLAQEGLLLSRPNCGVTVAPSAPDSVQELVMPLRRTIETYALRRFFDDITEDDYRTWGAILERLKEACAKRDWATCAEQDIAFHRSILERADQPDLLAIWATIVARLRGYFRQSYQKYDADPLKLYKEHRHIVDQFRTGNKQKAVKALERNIE